MTAYKTREWISEFGTHFLMITLAVTGITFSPQLKKTKGCSLNSNANTWSGPMCLNSKINKEVIIVQTKAQHKNIVKVDETCYFLYTILVIHLMLTLSLPQGFEVHLYPGPTPGINRARQRPTLLRK
jgi:hypothetical protein